MARVDATAAKAAAALAAAQLTTILQDDTLTELAIENKVAHSPMRDIEALFRLNPETGIVTSRDGYIDSVYAGNFPTGNIAQGLQSQGPATPITLVSADIEIAAPADIVLVFSASVFPNPATAIQVGGAAGELKKIVSVVYAGTTVTITMDSDFIAADVATVSGRFFGNRNNYVDLADEAVTNNIV